LLSVVIVPAIAWENGKIAFIATRAGAEGIYGIDEDGRNEIRLTTDTGRVSSPEWHPGGRNLVSTSDRDGNEEIYVMDADGTNQTRLTDDPHSDTSPTWSFSETKTAFSSDRDGSYEIYTMNTDGTDVRQVTTTLDGRFSLHPAWSPAGRKIAFHAEKDGDYEIYVMNADGSRQTQLTNNVRYPDSSPARSPDGTKIACQSNRSDGESDEIYVMNADGSGVTRLINNDDEFYYDETPAWSPDGRKIAFTSWHGALDGTLYEIYVMNADETGQKRVTVAQNTDWDPSWAPVPLTGRSPWFGDLISIAGIISLLLILKNGNTLIFSPLPVLIID
jgi:Tol biopolymer transport system component